MSTFVCVRIRLLWASIFDLTFGHATIADFDVVLVEDFVELVLSRKVLPDEFQENSSDVGGGVVAERGLNQMMFLFRLFHTRSYGVRLYSKLWLYPDLSRAAL